MRKPLTWKNIIPITNCNQCFRFLYAGIVPQAINAAPAKVSFAAPYLLLRDWTTDTPWRPYAPILGAIFPALLAAGVRFKARMAQLRQIKFQRMGITYNKISFYKPRILLPAFSIYYASLVAIFGSTLIIYDVARNKINQHYEKEWSSARKNFTASVIATLGASGLLIAPDTWARNKMTALACYDVAAKLPRAAAKVPFFTFVCLAGARAGWKAVENGILLTLAEWIKDGALFTVAERTKAKMLDSTLFGRNHSKLQDTSSTDNKSIPGYKK